MIKLYSFFHLNIMYSSIEESLSRSNKSLYDLIWDSISSQDKFELFEVGGAYMDSRMDVKYEGITIGTVRRKNVIMGITFIYSMMEMKIYTAMLPQEIVSIRLE